MTRLDAELVKRGIVQSRERAKGYITAGRVTVNGTTEKKPSNMVCENDIIEMTGEALRYVGRGGLKLEGAISAFNIDLSNRTCLDIGASTGGFTDCMLQNGATKVYAVDVGHGQLAQKLRDDPRVVNIEGVNVKDITTELFESEINFITADLSFISVRYAADCAKCLLKADSEAVLLIKPQFEAGRANISNGGIVKNKKVHIDVLHGLCDYFASLNFEIVGLVPSPIRGGDGNIEYLTHLVKRDCFTPSNFDYKKVCDKSFSLKG